MEKVLEYLEPKTFNKVHYVAMGFWILISVIFFAIYSFCEVENNLICISLASLSCFGIS